MRGKEMDDRKRFFEVFGHVADHEYFVPGRVNLIGEYTDYNGGNVFPCALTIGTYGTVRKREDQTLRFYSENFPEIGMVECSLEDLAYDPKHNWANYPKGVLWMMKKEGYVLEEGLDIYIRGTIPNGAGLSSSASIEVLMAFVLKDLFALDLDLVELAKLCQRVENQYIGVNSGIMDQFAVAMGEQDQAILLDTNTLTYRYSSILLEDASIVVANTNKKRGLQDSNYNERRAECEEALRRIQVKLPVQALCEMSYEQFAAVAPIIGEDALMRRARHAVTENERTLKAVKALENNRIEEFGQLMNESHRSLKEDFEVTGVELDTLVELAWAQKGTLGSRMTGAGYGGCSVSIVKNDDIASFIKEVGAGYEKAIGYAADFYVVSIGKGVHRIS